MILPFAAVAVILTAVVQLILCFCTRKRWVKLLPVCLIGIGELACAAGYFLFAHIYGAAFAAVIYAALLLMVLVGDGLAWLVYYLVKIAQKRG